MTGDDDRVQDAFRRGELWTMVQQHERQIRQLDEHIEQTGETLAAIRKDTRDALEKIRITLARITVAVPIVILLSNLLVALLIHELGE